MTPEFVMVAIIIELVALVVEFIIFFSQNNHKKDLTNHSKCAIIYTERKKGRKNRKR